MDTNWLLGSVETAMPRYCKSGVESGFHTDLSYEDNGDLKIRLANDISNGDIVYDFRTTLQNQR